MRDGGLGPEKSASAGTDAVGAGSDEEGAMRIRDWMTRHPVTVTPQTSVLYARRLLEGNRIRHLPVVTEGDRLVGIVSDRDVVLRDGEVIDALAAVQSDLASGRYRHLGEVMSTPPRVVRPDDPIGVAVDLCLRWKVGALPVVERGRLVGILTTTDCLRAFARVLDARPGAVRAVGSEALPHEPGG